MPPKVITLVGTRPELVKLSPVIPLLEHAFTHQLVHSGQHYSFEMDAIFFEELHLPQPTHRLNVGAGSHAEQTAQLLTRFEHVLLTEHPDAVLALGDTNTTMAGLLTAAKLNIPCAHVEAGCRSFNRQMPEEINRVVADHISTWCLAPGTREQAHLQAEGIPEACIFVVGSTAIDACLRNRDLASTRTLVHDLNLPPHQYAVLTLHRAENTTPDVLRGIMMALNQLAKRWPFIFPIHPRTRHVLTQLEQATPPLRLHPQLKLIPPVGYLDMLHLMSHARAVVTDSGGLQEEAATLRVPLLIVRQETEWHYLIEAGAAALTGNTYDSILDIAPSRLEQGHTGFKPIDISNQRGAAERIVQHLKELLTP